MTVIAWDWKTLAADKRMCSGTVHTTTTKIRQVRGHLCATTGDFDQGQEMFAWFERGASPDDFPQSQRHKDDWAGLIVVRPDGTLWKYERTPYPFPFDGRFAAFGSGREFAMAALHLGKSAREAAEVACALDTGCGNGIDTLTLD